MMKYPYRVFQTCVEEHYFWVAECPILKGCVGQGDTLEEALAELEANEQSWLELAEEYGLEIPAVPVEQMNAYSGKLTLRVAPYVHQEAAELAKKQNVSLNQYINDAIVSQNARLSSVGFIVPELKKAVSYVKELLFSPSGTQSNGSTSVTIISPFETRNNYKVFSDTDNSPFMVPAGMQ